MGKFCDLHFDGLGTECRRCRSWRRGKQAPDCPPYITRSEPDGDRLPDIKTTKQNHAAWQKYIEECDLADARADAHPGNG